MDYKAITYKNSPQYKLLYESGRLIIRDDGLLYIDGDYLCVAMGTRYGYVGDKLLITLSSGQKIKVCLSDIKSNKDTINCCHHLFDGSMLEILIDSNKFKVAHNLEYKLGSLNNLFNGVVIKVQKI